MYMESKYLEPQAVSLVERSTIHCPYLRGSSIEGFTVLICCNTSCLSEWNCPNPSSWYVILDVMIGS